MQVCGLIVKVDLKIVILVPFQHVHVHVALTNFISSNSFSSLTLPLSFPTFILSPPLLFPLLLLSLFSPFLSSLSPSLPQGVEM